MVSDTQYVYLVCALLYAVAVGWGATVAEEYLSPTESRRVALFPQVAFRTGDLLLWNSCFKLRTDLEKILCSSRFTHVSLVFVDRAGVPFVWETVGETGHRLCKLAPLLRDSGSHMQCVLRKISVPLDSRAFEALARISIGQPYSFGFWKGVVRRWFPYLELPVSDKPSLTMPRFCSELVADTYRRFGVLDFAHRDTSPALILPDDFAECRSTRLPWANGYSLGPEIQVEYGSTAQHLQQLAAERISSAEFFTHSA
jgi:hypothetical protein